MDPSLTDHESIKYISNRPKLRGRKAEESELMQELDMYHKGSLNSVTDALSHTVKVNCLLLWKSKLTYMIP